VANLKIDAPPPPGHYQGGAGRWRVLGGLARDGIHLPKWDGPDTGYWFGIADGRSPVSE